MKISSVTGLVTTAALNAKMTEIENKISDITNLVTKADLNTKVTEAESKKHTQIENKIPYATSFITTPEFYILTETIFDARMKQEPKSLTNV